MTPSLRVVSRTHSEVATKHRDEFESNVNLFFLAAIDYTMEYDIDLSKDKVEK